MPNNIMLSFAGCGFLGIYHVGVVSAFRELSPSILKRKVVGCSVGSLVAAAVVCNLETGKFEN
jgi:predicted acylesterase/phospholipase RssA